MRDDKEQIAIQESVIEWFKDYDNTLVIEVIRSFVYNKPATDERVSKVVEQFLKENGLTEAYINCVSDSKDSKSYFFKASSSQREMINLVNVAFLNMAMNRFIEAEAEKKKKRDKNKKGFNWIKTELLKVYEVMNNYDQYFNGKDEDEKFVEKVKNLKYETN